MANDQSRGSEDFFGASDRYLDETSELLNERSELIETFSSSSPDEDPGLIWRDKRMQRLVTVAESIAKTPSTVLLSGESGVGKEVLASFIHRKSPRKDEAFVAVNCAALPPNLLESELFGHKKGAFSGAIDDRKGMFERANGGTLLLDEVSEMPVELQSKLLRVIQERTLTPVGGSRDIEVDIRLIATTNRDLESYVEEGGFRQDLYYRLNVFPLEIPPLRKRRDDIEPIARLFLARFSQKLGHRKKFVTAEAIKRLETYDYPGNVRELINVLERAVVFAGESRVIEEHHLVLDNKVTFLDDFTSDIVVDGDAEILGEEPSGVVSFKAGEESLTDVRRKIILETLRQFEGNRTRTAEALGVSVRTVRNRLNEYEEKGYPIPE
jgi:transcriptional regulator with PAS, ATPase and Fis domain